MKKVNKKLPVSVLKELKEFVNPKLSETDKLFCVIDSEDYLFKTVDIDQTSDFYYTIEEYSTQNGYLLSYKPMNQNEVGVNRLYVKADKLSFYFKIWHDCLIAYAELEEDQDPFLTNLENQFLDGFNLSDESKNEPLKLNQIYYLEESLTKIENEIGHYVTPETAPNITEIIEDVEHLKSQLGRKSQEWVAKKLANILAKITKEGPDILKGIFKETGKQIMIQGIKFLLENGNMLIN
ncbi:hypothetical protein GCM10023149_10950 [Mucilaginibacter gynuensis]|uniref:Uncharacterized protein n=1 Tax=Mucilaginibacter gynuensis TaxID=1302236 RepID=A0ABP8G0A4_9SPHI